MSSPYPIAANAAMYDPAQAEEYLAMLFRHVDWEPGQVISLLGIGEKGTEREGIFRDRQIIAPGFIGMAHGHLKRWAAWHGAGFVVPAVLHSTAQEKGDVTLDKIAALTTIILDLDSGPIAAQVEYVTERLGKPTMRVASGGKTTGLAVKQHLYWLLSEPCEDVERVAALRKLLASKVGGDQSFGRATQVIRVPGSVHAKNGNPSVCSIIDRSTADYDLGELADIIENMQPMDGVEVEKSAPLLTLAGGMDFTPLTDTAVAALHRDIDEGGNDLTRWSEFSKVAGFNISEVRAGRITAPAALEATNGWMLAHMNPPWPQARFDQEFRALVDKDVTNHGPFPQSGAATAAASVSEGITPTPASWPLAASIPPRPRLMGNWLQRGIVTAMIAPGGVGKSSLVSTMMLSLASGRPLLRQEIYGGPATVWYWNLEDGGDNLARSRIAASIHHGVKEADCGGRMYVDSGPEGATLCTATEDRNGFQVVEPVIEAIIAAILARKIDVLVIDPFVSSHAIDENDNNKIDAVAKAWARVAVATGCAVVLVHHSVKMRGDKVTADSARGAGALSNAARMTLVLNRMDQEQADGWGIDPHRAARFFSVVDDKHNLSAAQAPDWFELVSVSLDNATEIYEADSIGVVTPWTPPRPMDGVGASDLFQIQKVIHAGTYWRDMQSKADWVGDVVANVLRIDGVEAKSRKRINGMLKVWLASGALKSEARPHPVSRKMRDAVVVGHWAGDLNAFANSQEQDDGR